MSFDGEHRSVVYGLMTGILGRAQCIWATRRKTSGPWPG